MKLIDWLNRVIPSRFSSARKSRRKLKKFDSTQAEILEDRCLLATITVTNINDTGAGSLRDAITMANSGSFPGADVIEFDSSLVGQTIELVSAGFPNVTETLTINGPIQGSDTGITVDGNNATRILAVDNATLNLNNLTLTGGSTAGDGGALLVLTGGTANLDNVQISSSTGSSGGAIRNDGTLSLSNSRIVGNSAAIYGGAVFNAGGSSMTISKSHLVSNTAGSAGGAVASFGGATGTISLSVIDNNQAVDGGGINSSGTLRLVNTKVTGNFANVGGGIANRNAGIMDIRRSTISGNVATVNGGGGISHTGQNMGIRDSTISGNTAADGSGGIETNSQISARQTTIAHNLGRSETPGGVVAGGVGLLDGANVSSFRHLTIANNIVISNSTSSSAGGIAIQNNPAVNVDLRNSILAQNLHASMPANNNNNGVIDNNQNNAISDLSVLGPLQDNGGPTLTMLPREGLGIVDALAVETNSFFLTDQRGFSSNVNGMADIGAVEVQRGLRNPYVTASPAGTKAAEVRVYEGDGTLVRIIQPYGDGYFGEIHVALGDVNGDGTKDIITGPGNGGGSHIRIFNGRNGSVISEFFPYPTNYFGGAFVAAGDVNGDGFDDVITAPAAFSGIQVIAFDGQNASSGLIPGQSPTAIQSFTTAFSGYFGGAQGGVTLATGDINEDGFDDIITGFGEGSHTQPQVQVFEGSASNFASSQTPILSFNPFDPSFTGGVFVAADDVNSDQHIDIIVGPGAGIAPNVQVVALSGTATPAILGTTSFEAYPTIFQGGVRVGTQDFNGDGFTDIVTGAGPGGGPILRIFSGRPGNEVLFEQFAAPQNTGGGIFVGGSVHGNRESYTLRVDADLSEANVGPVIEATTADVTALKNAAIKQFHDAGLDEAAVARLKTVTVQVTDLEGDLLGLAFGNTIVIDSNAAGFGYFIDTTPGDDIEFQTANSGTLGRVDLLTVIAHELGHIAGLLDLDHYEHGSELMSERLVLGVRRRVDEEDLDALDSLFAPHAFQELF